MDTKLLIQASIKFLMGLVVIALLLFIPAGTICYWNGWLFMGVLFIPMLIAGVVLFLKSPTLLKKRLASKESETEQKFVGVLSAIMFVSGFVVSALDFRYGWSNLSRWLVFVAAVIFLVAYGIYAEVMRENVYLSRVIEVQESQKVIDTGLYGIVRHPMYFATLFLFLAIPLILGSVYAFVIFLIYPIILFIRIKNEESVLEKELPGYIAYTKKVKYRLIPFVW